VLEEGIFKVYFTPGWFSMKYGEIIGQAWQIVKRTRILWVLGLMNFLVPFIKFGKTNDYTLNTL
jgi:hypothetical protein